MIQQIHERALAAAARYKSAEIELIEILQIVGEHRVFYHLKYSSLFQYAVGALGLSEEVAYIYINVSRKAAEVPALKDEIKAGNISVSKAKVISPVLKDENKAHWFAIARSSSKRQIEREVALASPNQAVRERARYVSEMPDEQAKILQLAEVFVELKLGVPEKLMLNIRQAQDLVSQSKRRHASLVETLAAITELYIEKKDPLERAKRQKMRGKLNEPVPGPVNVNAASKTREAFTSSVKHQVYLMHQGKCAHLDQSGERCSRRRMLEIHHIVPVAKGGTNELCNLVLLCQGHHRSQHVFEAGVKHGS